jgi:hypothetical protein
VPFLLFYCRPLYDYLKDTLVEAGAMTQKSDVAQLLRHSDSILRGGEDGGGYLCSSTIGGLDPNHEWTRAESDGNGFG